MTHLRMIGFYCACGAAGMALAQSITTQRGGVTFDTAAEAPVVLAPPPVRADGDLVMASLPVTREPIRFYLTFGTGGRYGPYPLAHHARIGPPNAPYLLNLVGPGRGFTLTAPDTPHTVYGPFAATNGAPVRLGQTEMTFERIAPVLTVTLAHPDRINQLPLIGIAPDSPTLERELHILRAKYAALANRVDAETADVFFHGMPRVTRHRSGTITSPTVSPSQRDKQNAVRGAELSAVRFLETLVQQHFRIRSQAMTGPLSWQFAMPPGDYLFCAMQKIKDPQAKGVTGLATAIWWTPFTFDGEHPLALALTTDNAITWRDVFVLTRE
ncbi:MAG TPA: hypothetical protein P5026_00410 [Kiritimatiellia bacterium]|nr:hypothetical protein [Kiritimatiellia bacterium]HRU70250.1 hypothetical protein [Kiritimatiellia bacterium]